MIRYLWNFTDRIEVRLDYAGPSHQYAFERAVEDFTNMMILGAEVNSGEMSIILRLIKNGTTISISRGDLRFVFLNDRSPLLVTKSIYESWRALVRSEHLVLGDAYLHGVRIHTHFVGIPVDFSSMGEPHLWVTEVTLNQRIVFNASSISYPDAEGVHFHEIDYVRECFEVPKASGVSEAVRHFPYRRIKQ